MDKTIVRRAAINVNEYETYGKVKMGEGVFVGKHCVFACPKEETIRHDYKIAEKLISAPAPIQIGKGSLILNYVCIYEGTTIGDNCLIEDHVRIGYGCRIASNTRIMYGSYVCDRVVIAKNARIAGFICDGSKIGPFSTVMGSLVHEYTRPWADWWEVNEQAPIICSKVVVGFGSTIVGGVKIGSGSYIAAGAIVTEDVSRMCVVKGINERVPLHRWRGKRLSCTGKNWRNR